jgi:redox-sensitive bicupin YhaK (pirin superfamily)
MPAVTVEDISTLARVPVPARARSALSRTPDLDVVVLGGQPLREPIAMYGPFVMNTAEEVRDAFTDSSAGRLGSVPAQRVAHGDLRGQSE